MSKEEIIEGNKLIAEFMGVHFDADDFIGDKSMYGNAEAVRYHRDWSWLMPVVEKISEIDISPAPNWRGYSIIIFPRGYIQITGFPMPKITTNVSIEGSLINAVYVAAIKFIKRYNSQKNTHQ